MLDKIQVILLVSLLGFIFFAIAGCLLTGVPQLTESIINAVIVSIALPLFIIDCFINSDLF